MPGHASVTGRPSLHPSRQTGVSPDTGTQHAASTGTFIFPNLHHP